MACVPVYLFGIRCGFLRFATSRTGARCGSCVAARQNRRIGLQYTPWLRVLDNEIWQPIVLTSDKIPAGQCWQANKAQVRGGVGVEAILARSDA